MGFPYFTRLTIEQIQKEKEKENKNKKTKNKKLVKQAKEDNRNQSKERCKLC